MKYTKQLIKLSLLVSFAFLAFTINSSNILAEQTTGVIRGSVVDDSGNLFQAHLFR
jgi:hypothetical protein